MTKSYPFLPLLGLLFLAGCQKPEQVPAGKNQSSPQHVLFQFKENLYRNRIDSVFKKYDFNGSVAVFQDSALVFRKNQGFEDFRTKTEIGNHSVFAIGSVSKQFTAVMVLRLCETGKIRLQDLVSEYLSSFHENPAYRAITISQLLCHTSGISDSGNGLLFKNGSGFGYSNKGYYYLGKLIEKISGKSFDQNAHELFRMAGMSSSYTSDHFNGNHFANAYLGTEKQWQALPDMPQRLSQRSISAPAGGILSTIDDLHRWNQSLFQGKILTPQSLRLLLEKRTVRAHEILGKCGYGYGIMINTGTPESYFHTGYVKGSPSLLVYYPKTKTSLIVLSNIANEALGKSGFFSPHKHFRQISDEMETAGGQMDDFNDRIEKIR